MAESIYALITANIKTVLATITTANGYNTNVAIVEQERSFLNINNRFPYVLLLENEPSPNEEYDQFRDDEFSYLIWYLDDADDAVTGTALSDVNTEFTYKNRNVPADIAKALKLDPTRGGYAQNTQITGWNHGFFIDGEIMAPGTWVHVKVQCITNPDNPYSL
jgi:hypothetical protein